MPRLRLEASYTSATGGPQQSASCAVDGCAYSNCCWNSTHSTMVLSVWLPLLSCYFSNGCATAAAAATTVNNVCFPHSLHLVRCLARTSPLPCSCWAVTGHERHLKELPWSWRTPCTLCCARWVCLSLLIRAISRHNKKSVNMTRALKGLCCQRSCCCRHVAVPILHAHVAGWPGTARLLHSSRQHLCLPGAQVAAIAVGGHATFAKIILQCFEGKHLMHW